MKRMIYLPLIALGTIAGLAYGENEIRNSVIAAGGGTVTSAHHRIRATIGEPIIGSASSASTSITAGFWATVTPAATCPGDLNGDGQVNLADLTQLLSHFGLPGGAADGDITGDGLVDLTDLATMLSVFGSSC